MIKSAVTVSLVPEVRGGPFVFWDDLDAACGKAAALGFDAVEVFPRGPGQPDADALRQSLDRHGLRLAAMGTGAGWAVHRLSLLAEDAAAQRKAADFIRSVIDVAGPLGAPAIVGSMQGRYDERHDQHTMDLELVPAFAELAEHARQYSVPLLLEPLNRYETNVVTNLAVGAEIIRRVGAPNLKLLADLFHMNIEEADVAAAIRAAGPLVGHVHLADSNRRPAGCGHTDFASIAAALREIGYDGYASAEALPYPNSEEAARLTIQAFSRYFR